MIEGVENRVVFIGMDQARDELLYSNVKGKNPFKDKRVRQALYEAIDIDAINKTTMRGLSKPTGALLPAPKMSTPEIEARLPYDKVKAKSCSPKRATRTGSRSRSIARTIATSTTRRSARRWRRCGARSACHERQRDAARQIFSEARDRPTPASTCSDGAAGRPTRCSRFSRC